MFKQASDARVAVFVAPGLEEIEGLTVVDLLFRAGVPCDTVAITPERQVTSSHEVTIVCDRSISDAGFSFDDYDLLVLPGGTTALNDCEALKKQLLAFAEAGKDVAAICAAPMVLGGLGLLRGKRATAYPGFEQYLDGADFTPEAVVTDGHIITGRGPGLTFAFALALLERLQGKQAADEVAAQMLLK